MKIYEANITTSTGMNSIVLIQAETASDAYDAMQSKASMMCRASNAISYTFTLSVDGVCIMY